MEITFTFSQNHQLSWCKSLSLSHSIINCLGRNTFHFLSSKISGFCVKFFFYWSSKITFFENASFLDSSFIFVKIWCLASDSNTTNRREKSFHHLFMARSRPRWVLWNRKAGAGGANPSQAAFCSDSTKVQLHHRLHLGAGFLLGTAAVLQLHHRPWIETKGGHWPGSVVSVGGCGCWAIIEAADWLVVPSNNTNHCPAAAKRPPEHLS